MLVFSSGATTTARAYVRARRSQVAIGVLSERLIFSSLLVLIALSAVPYGSVEPWWEGIFESAIFVLAAGCILTTVGQRWHLPIVLWPIVALIIVACLQIVPVWHMRSPSDVLVGTYQTISVDPFETKRFIFKFLAIALTLAMLLRHTTSRQRLLALLNLIILVGAASAVSAMCRWLLPETAFTAVWNRKLQGESFGQFMNRNHFALLMEMSIGPALAMVYVANSHRMRVLYGAALLVIWTALVSTNSRGGLVSLLGQCALLSWIIVRSLAGFYPKQRTDSQNWWQRVSARSRGLALRSVLLLFLLGGIFASSLWVGGDRVRQRLESVPSEMMLRSNELQNSSPRRIEIWASTWDLIKAHPFAGSGLGAYNIAISKYFRPTNEWQPEQAHNEYLELVAGGGIPVAILGIWFVFVIWREVRTRLSEPDRFRRVVCVGAVLSFVGIAIHSLVDFGLHLMVNALICAVLIVIATANIQSSPTRITGTAT